MKNRRHLDGWRKCLPSKGFLGLCLFLDAFTLVANHDVLFDHWWMIPSLMIAGPVVMLLLAGWYILLGSIVVWEGERHPKPVETAIRLVCLSLSAAAIYAILWLAPPLDLALVLFALPALYFLLRGLFGPELKPHWGRSRAHP
jgi:hypothetical protein